MVVGRNCMIFFGMISPRRVDGNDFDNAWSTFYSTFTTSNAQLVTVDSDQSRFPSEINMNEEISTLTSLREIIKDLDEHFHPNNSEDNIDIDLEESYSGGYYFICGVCRRWYESTASLIIHFSGHFQDCPTCEKCGESFAEAQDYADHCAQHVGYTCLVCEETFFEKPDFDAHVLEHKLKCFKCKKRFSSEEELRNHYTKHYDIINLQCEMCHNYFSSRRSLRFHKSSQHSISKQYKCKFCNEKFTQLSSQKRHIRFIHKHCKPFVCHLCGKKYTIKGSLETHLLNHSGEKPYCCIICDRRFADKRNFKRHGQQHVAIESVPCKICGKVFPTDKKLRSHVWLHLNEGAYKCDMCPRSFSYSSHLKRHKMQHSGERPHVCKICGSDYIERYELARHLKKKHKFNQEKVDKIMAFLKFGSIEEKSN
ncbi:zinc finger protein [Trichonephila inaurata madagascariensis]|uniref:Zinc finger protein n=1 Tax=Trichonephila inaurata madagascariensis TaxID=2747483 RepID=A0A8X6MM33_9ARAC|nr:zinc finger protein [Trichonephila inaurata madagascariensis]